MQTKNSENQHIPTFLPHGWKKEVAKELGVHPVTIKRNIGKESGPMFERIVRKASEIYGEKREVRS